ncbi:MAG: ABC transporter substrate-binding protein [Deltaproteobacteria bacterium]|nr:ABC transporter substrate-binding protein [Deltaproteobacteria bacterium]
MKKKLLSIVLPLAACIGLSGQARALDKVLFGMPMPSGKTMPLIMAKESGMFEKQGLDVELKYFNSGTMATTALVAESVAISCSGGTDAIQAMLGGADIVIVGGIFNYVDGHLVSAKTITRPEQLKGKAVGISAFGANSEFQARTALKRLGLGPSDVTLLQVGAPAQRLAALESGNVQATIIEPPLNLMARKTGMNTLLDLLDLRIPAEMIVIATTKANLQKNPQMVEKVLRGVVSGIHYMRTHKQETLAVMKKSMKIDDMDALEETYNQVLIKGVPEKPYAQVEGVQVLLTWLAEKNPAARSADPSKMVDSTIIKRLDGSGFIDALYKK